MNRPNISINPGSDITVDIITLKHTTEYKSEQVYFRCYGCKIKFDADPEKNMKKANM